MPACTGLSCELAFSPPASDDRGVVRVEFRVANVLKCTDSTSPYTCAWAVPEQANVSDVLTGERGARTTDRVLAIVLFTDIVGSTSQVATLGDERWGEMRAAHHEAVRRELERFRGREVDTAGDGFFATFDGPGRAIRCAQAIGAAVRRLGLEVRAGVHTGECEIRGAEVSGIAVHIGARVMALAGPSEVLVSQTVKDLAYCSYAAALPAAAGRPALGLGQVADHAALQGSLDLDVARDDPMPRRGRSAQDPEAYSPRSG